MRNALVIIGTLCLVATSTAAQGTSPGGGKKHHKTDSVSSNPSDATLNSSTTPSTGMIFKSDPAFAGTTTVASGEPAATEVLGVVKTGKFSDNNPRAGWEFSTLNGSAVVGFGEGGTWGFSGTFTGSKKAKLPVLEIAMAVKASNGHVLIFRYVGTTTKGKNKWEGGGIDQIVRVALPSLIAEGFEMRGAYRMISTAEAATEMKEPAEGDCSLSTQAAMAAGYAPLWSWAGSKKGACTQHNLYGSP